MKNIRTTWIPASLLTLPIIVYFLAYWFNHASDLTPTGFIQYDNPSYIAYAKQYLDADKIQLFYSNPFNDSGNYEAIYFQPQTLLIAFLIKLGIAPAVILTFFTVICSLLCFAAIIKIYDTLYPAGKHRSLSITFFAWGGGIFFLSGFVAQIIYPSIQHLFGNKPLILDPGSGWWGMNLGRSLFFSCEAWYHLLFLFSVLLVLKKRWFYALLMMFTLSLSHPFTGVELLSIMAAWVCIEKIVAGNRTIPLYFVAGTLLLLAFHIYYYLYFLHQFPDHASISQQYSLNWRIRFYNMIPAWFIVGILSIITIRIVKWRTILSESSSRLFITWFFIALILANHEMFMKPMQPIHFTRGYIWTSLFLFGLPGTQHIFSTLEKWLWRRPALVLLSTIFLLDNGVWILSNARAKAGSTSVSYISKEEKNVLDTLAATTDNKSLVIGYSDEQEAMIPYLATVYTKAWPWTSHPFTTPFIERKRTAYERFIVSGTIDSSWKNRHCVIIFRKTNNNELKRAASLNFPFTLLLDSKLYIVVSANNPGN
jgi:hypothetical protein